MNKFSDTVFILSILHWKKVALAAVAGLIGLGYVVGQSSADRKQDPQAKEAAAQETFNTRAKEAFADLGITLVQSTTLVFAKTPSCGGDQPYGADFEAIVNKSGKAVKGTICMTQERQGKIIVGN